MVGAIVGILGEWAVTKAADVLLEQTGNQIKTRLNQDDLKQAIAYGIQAAEKAEASVNTKNGLFFHCDDRQIRIFKQTVFSNSVVQTELQRTFGNEGKPRLEFLSAGFRQTATNSDIKLNEVVLKPWLETFIDAYFDKTSAIQFRIAKEDYCEQLANWYDDVKFAGIAVEGTVIDEAKELQNIFVMPDAIAEVSRQPDRFNGVLTEDGTIIWGTVTLYENLPPEYTDRNSRQVALIQEQRQQARQAGQQWSGAKILASQLLSQSDSTKLVLLGAPGSGKTTLMSYFAVMLAKGKLEPLGLAADTEWLPILIRIRELALHPEISILDYARRFAENTMSCMPLPGGFFEAWVENGRALILLDGLDEVAEEGKRQEIVRKIENFLGQYNQNRAIVTSRPAGYRRDFFRTAEYPHYQLQPFDNPKIEQFITNWYDSRILDYEEAERRKNSLKKALGNNDRIKVLARNPLLLTIIALIHRYQAELPRDRYRLYDKAVDTLLTTWDASREITNHQALQYLRLDDLRRLMERLAYWVHTQGGTGDSEGGTLIDRDELITQLSQYIREQKKLERNEAKAEAKRFLRHIRDRTGLLNEQGQDCYAFVHKTFQEYLTAQEIRDRQEEGFEVVLEHILGHLHDPHWREVLLLLIAQQKRSNPAKCLQSILDAPDPYGGWLHRNLFFAGTCLAEDISVEDETLSARILDELVALELSNSSLGSQLIHSQVLQTLCNLCETKFETPALQRLLNVPVGKIDIVRLQSYRAALGDEDGAITTLLGLLRGNDKTIRAYAADVISQIGKLSDNALSALLSLLNYEDSNVRAEAADAILQIGKSSDKVLQALLSLCRDEARNVQERAVAAIGQLGIASDEIVKTILPLCAYSHNFGGVISPTSAPPSHQTLVG